MTPITDQEETMSDCYLPSCEHQPCERHYAVTLTIRLSVEAYTIMQAQERAEELVTSLDDVQDIQHISTEEL